jgi:hypothetical protein
LFASGLTSGVYEVIGVRFRAMVYIIVLNNIFRQIFKNNFSSCS